jgi:hypothetical protein
MPSAGRPEPADHAAQLGVPCDARLFNETSACLKPNNNGPPNWAINQVSTCIAHIHLFMIGWKHIQEC